MVTLELIHPTSRSGVTLRLLRTAVRFENRVADGGRRVLTCLVVPMSPENRTRILAAIQEKAPTQGNCTVCGSPTFTLADGFLSLTVTDNAVAPIGSPPRLPSVALICSKCGNTVILNLFRLGLGDLVDQVPTVTPPNG